MDTLAPAVVKEYQDLAKISNAENRTMVLVTPGPHSKHYGFADSKDINKDFIRFRTLEGATISVPWAPGTYLELLPAPINT